MYLAGKYCHLIHRHLRNAHILKYHEQNLLVWREPPGLHKHTHTHTYKHTQIHIFKVHCIFGVTNLVAQSNIRSLKNCGKRLCGDGSGNLSFNRVEIIWEKKISKLKFNRASCCDQIIKLGVGGYQPKWQARLLAQFRFYSINFSQLKYH